MNMNDKWGKLYAALKDINNNYGADIVSAPNKVKNLLLDFAPSIPNEVKAFSNVICDSFEKSSLSPKRLLLSG